LGDASRLRQILNNLLSNAIKFTAQGQVLLRLSIVEETSTTVIIYFEIIDTGMGIAPADQSRLFQLYSQAERFPSQSQGTGLGLFISRQLVQKMGGEIDLISTLSKGTTFWIKLPLEKIAEEPKESVLLAPSDSQNSVDLDTVSLSDKKLLIVEDNLTCQQILLHETSAWLKQVEVASTFQQALESLLDAYNQGQPFQILLIDANLPDLNSTLLLKKLKTDFRFVELAVVMMTSLQQTLEPSLVKQLAGVLPKPVFQSNLLKCLRAAIDMQDEEEFLEVSSQRRRLPPPRWHILLADDNIINQEVGKEILKQLGCKVFLANQGLEAFQAILQQRFDLVFMDCNMPEMDGFTASRKIREYEQQQQLPHLPIIAFTADVMPTTRERCLAAGMDDYLTKPIVFNDLKKKLEDWLGSKIPEVNSAYTPVARQKSDNSTLLDNTYPLDPAVLEDMRNNMQGRDVKWIITLFLQELPNYLGELQKAIEAEDGQALYLASHKFKGATSILVAHRVVALCKVLETLGREGAFEDAAEPLGQMRIECENLLVSLTALNAQ
jgi:CheY-like chemotaxis protein/HPt (histidine-containing phosphotransfer) domain-containing protein